ncbi:hypothetical protein HDU79_004729 [Rhizoclosmatium sp. JEL0117]|nr:hypothetical protein HDU79_004729 [Rhizoclosmatium sp. JEL0117]
MLYAIAGFVFWGLLVIIGNGAIIVSFLRYYFPPTSSSAQLPKEEAPGVSILRPLKGVDTNLIDNLKSAILLEYPNFEIIFSIADADDAAIQVVKDLMKEFPDVDMKLIVGTY